MNESHFFTSVSGEKSNWNKNEKFLSPIGCAIKVQLFWEGHNLRNLSHGLDIYLVNIQTIVQIFVAFSEKRNFYDKMTILWLPNNMWSLIPIVVDIWLNA